MCPLNAHKPNTPLCPVVPNINTHTYQLSKYMESFLQQSAQNIVDSFELAEFITAVIFLLGYALVSWYVVSFFKNIPNDLVRKDIIMNWHNIKQLPKTNLDLLMEL